MWPLQNDLLKTISMDVIKLYGVGCQLLCTFQYNSQITKNNLDTKQQRPKTQTQDFKKTAKTQNKDWIFRWACTGQNRHNC